MTAVRRRLGAVGDRNDRGSTLSEMLVVMIIMGIVVATTAALTIGLTRTTAQNTNRQNQVDAARTAVERIAKTTRTAVKPSQLLTNCTEPCASATAFMAGTATSIKFFANLDNPNNSVGPSQISYTVGTTGADAGVLIERVQLPDPLTSGSTGYTYCNADAAGASASCKKTVTVTRFTGGVSTATPMFTYYDAAGTPIPVAAGGSLTAQQLAGVLAIEVSLKVTSTGSSAPGPTTYIQRITLPNAQAVVQEGKTP